MERGAAQRATGATKLNEMSSRSHAVFIIIVEKSTVMAEDSLAAEDEEMEQFRGLAPGHSCLLLACLLTSCKHVALGCHLKRLPTSLLEVFFCLVKHAITVAALKMTQGGDPEDAMKTRCWQVTEI